MKTDKIYFVCLLVLLWISIMCQTTTAQTFVFPQIAEGDGYRTALLLNNLTDSTASVEVDWTAASGESAGSSTAVLTGYASSVFEPSMATPFVGWAQVHVTPATVRILVSETLRLFDASGVELAQTDFAPPPPDSTLLVPLEDIDGYATSIALANPSSVRQSVYVTLHGSDGTVGASVPVSLPPGSQSAKFLREMIPSLYSFEGTLELASTSPVYALVLRNAPSGSFSAVPIAGAGAQPYFSPNGGISSLIVQQIQSATSSIDIAIYSFTRSEIAQALIEAGKRGVAIRLIADSSESDEEGSQLTRLESAGIDVKIIDGTGGGIMHNKYAIFDGRYLLTGSYNWTTSAEDDNNENAIFLNDAVAVAEYQADFNRLWPQQE